MKKAILALTSVSLMLCGADRSDSHEFWINMTPQGNVIVTQQGSKDKHRIFVVVGKKPECDLPIFMSVSADITCDQMKRFYARTHDIIMGYRPFTTCATMLWMHPKDPMCTAVQNPVIAPDMLMSKAVPHGVAFIC